MRLLGRNIALADVALALAGVVGMLAYALLLPSAHPDATARYELGPEEAEARARTFLEEQGYPTSDLERDEVTFERETDLIESLQHALGRREALRLLADSADTWPGYHWEVNLEGAIRFPSSDASPLEGGDGVDAHLLLSQSGAPYGLTLSGLPPGIPPGRDGAGLMVRHLDREALRYATAGETAGAPPPGDPATSALPDSLLARTARFALRSGRAAPSRASSSRGARWWADSALDSAAAVRVARFHLEQTPLGALFAAGGGAVRVDSVWAPPGTRQRVAAVRLLAERRGQTVRADVEVFATGGLRTLAVAFNPEEEGDEGLTLRAWFGIVGTVLCVFIGIGLLVAFFRRLSERMIDVRAGVIDAVIMGLMLVGIIFLSDGGFSSGSGASTWQRIGVALLGGGISFAFITLFSFPFVTAANAVGRSAFSGKMLSMSMVRRLAFRNRYVGAALLRGVALAGVLLGTDALALALLPGAVAHTGSGALETGMAASLLGSATAVAGFIGYGLLVLVVGLAAFLVRKVPARSTAAVVAGTAVLMAFVHLGGGGALSLEPTGYNALLGALSGAFFGASLMRYDALTVFLAIFLTILAGVVEEGWLVAGSPGHADVWLGLLLVGALAGLGFVGLWSGKTGRGPEDYTPSYVKEMAQQQRLQRDIEIAEEVQRSFLPRRMPRVEGLGLAALCLPAREVGGDYYDFIELPGGRLGVVVGDVSGKGIQASFYMTLAKGFFQTLAEEDRSPAEVLGRLNALFRRNAPRGTFITMIYGVADPAEGIFRFARAGHNPLVHCRAGDGEAEPDDGGAASENGEAPAREAHQLQPRGLAIGLADGARFDDTLEEVVLPFAAGDALVLYTDGFPEARTAGGEEFGEERIRARIERHGDRPAQQLLQTLADDVHTFIESAGRHDDMTMVVITRTTAAASENGRADGAIARRNVERRS